MSLRPGTAVGLARAGAGAVGFGPGARDRDHPRHRHPGGDRLSPRPDARWPDSGRDHRRHADLERRGMGRPPQPPGRRDGRGERVERGPGHDGGVRRAGVRRAHSREDSRHGSRRVLGAPWRSDRSSGGRRGEVLRRADPRRGPRAGVAPRPGRPRALGGGRPGNHARPRARRSRRRGGRSVRQREHATRRGARRSAVYRGGEAGSPGQPLLVGTGDAGLRVRGRQARMELVIALSAGVPYGSP